MNVSKTLIVLVVLVVILFAVSWMYQSNGTAVPANQPVITSEQPVVNPTLAVPSAPASTGVMSLASVEIKNFAFVPPQINIFVGDKVVWTNNDSAQHSVVISGVWESANFGTGEQFELTFDKPGTYSYICGLHKSMSGTVVVTSR